MVLAHNIRAMHSKLFYFIHLCRNHRHEVVIGKTNNSLAHLCEREKGEDELLLGLSKLGQRASFFKNFLNQLLLQVGSSKSSLCC